ncbi:hypothetical protein Hanom_Chr06g00479201 [Helianthus anomalus]
MFIVINKKLHTISRISSSVRALACRLLSADISHPSYNEEPSPPISTSSTLLLINGFCCDVCW